jgi:hypothetical protein
VCGADDPAAVVRALRDALAPPISVHARPDEAPGSPGGPRNIRQRPSMSSSSSSSGATQRDA